MTKSLFSIFWFSLALLSAPLALGQEGGEKIPAKEGDKIEAEADGKKSKKIEVKKKGVLDVSDWPPAESDGRCTRRESERLKEITKRDPEFGKELSEKLNKTRSLRDRFHYLISLVPEWERRVDLVEFSFWSGIAGQKEARRVLALKMSIRFLSGECLAAYLTAIKQNMQKAGKDGAAYKKFREEFFERVGEYAAYHRKNRADRRKKLDLPKEEGGMKESKSSDDK